MGLDHARYRDEFDGLIRVITDTDTDTDTELEDENKKMGLLLLSETATKELSLAIRDSTAQVDVDYCHTEHSNREDRRRAGTHYLDALQMEIMDEFEFEKGSHLFMTRFTLQVCRRCLEQTVSHNPAIRSEMVDVLVTADPSRLPKE